ncbi:MAG: sulfatase [Planctomycetota bacterium]|nr:sulfatase [Planctomycetota bacterium]
MPTGPNVVVIAIDTLRADALSSQGGRAGVSPRIDALAASGARFRAAFSHAPWTLPSFSSLYTSLPPQAHGAGGNVREGWRALGEEQTTIAEHFRDAGWATHAIVNVDFLTEPFGTAQGFDDVDARIANDNHEVRRAGPTTDAALRWLDARPERPFFLLVHYFDPHAEYDPPAPWRARFAAEPDRESSGFRFGAREHVVNHRNGRMPLDAATLARARALYDGEVAYTDDEVGRLLDGLAARGLDAHTIVVLTSDHGEEFGEHGSWEHGHTHFDELLHVPLVIRAPGLPPRGVDEPVGLMDVAPTVCALAGLAPPPSFRGRDLASALRDGTPLPPLAGLAAYGNFWGPAIESWREARWKRIDGGAAPLLFDWIADPRERDERAAAEPAILAASRAACQAFLAELGAVPARRGAAVRPDSKARERLESVGYTGGEKGR